MIPSCDLNCCKSALINLINTYYIFTPVIVALITLFLSFQYVDNVSEYENGFEESVSIQLWIFWIIACKHKV